MRILIRTFGLSCVGFLFILMMMHINLADIRQNELEQVSTTAITQVQTYAREYIEDEIYGLHNARIRFTSNEEYLADLQNCLAQLISPSVQYDIDVYAVDYSKGYIDVEISCTYDDLFGNKKTISTRKSSIVDIDMRQI